MPSAPEQVKLLLDPQRVGRLRAGELVLVTRAADQLSMHGAVDANTALLLTSVFRRHVKDSP